MKTAMVLLVDCIATPASLGKQSQSERYSEDDARIS